MNCLECIQVLKPGFVLLLSYPTFTLFVMILFCSFFFFLVVVLLIYQNSPDCVNRPNISAAELFIWCFFFFCVYFCFVFSFYGHLSFIHVGLLMMYMLKLRPWKTMLTVQVTDLFSSSWCWHLGLYYIKKNYVNNICVLWHFEMPGVYVWVYLWACWILNVDHPVVTVVISQLFVKVGKNAS